MSQVLSATFEDGVLKPEGKLNLPPGTKVRLTLDVWTATPAQEDCDELDRLCNEIPIDSGERLSRDQLHERR